MKRLRQWIEWIKDHRSEIFLCLQALFTISGIFAFNFFNDAEHRDILIVALLTMISADLFWVMYEYLIKLSKKADNTETLLMQLNDKIRQIDDIIYCVKQVQKDLGTYGYGIQIYENRNKFAWQKCVSEATHDIFISGTTLTKYIGEKNFFLNLKNSIKTRFLVLNISDEIILNGFRQMRYKDNLIHTNQRYINQASLFKDLYHNLYQKKNFEFAVSDRITPISYFAIDIQKISPKTFIRVQHYLHEKEADDTSVTYIVRPGNPLFDIYKEQIEILWNNAETKNTYFMQP